MVRSAAEEASGPVTHVVMSMKQARWWLGLRPYAPLKVAGTRMLPPPSVPMTSGTTPAPTAEEPPDVEPPG
jgi:hypothetical protein